MLLQAASTSQSTVMRTGILWLMSNLGGTLWLLLDFSLDRLADYPIALLTGLVAAIASLTIVPLAIPFFALMCYLRVGFSRRTLALLGVTLFFLLANQLLLHLLPIDYLGSLLRMSWPYWVAAVAAVLWLYGPAQREDAPTSACG